MAYLEAALQCGTFRIGNPRLKKETELLAEELMRCEADMMTSEKICNDMQIYHVCFLLVFSVACSPRWLLMFAPRNQDEFPFAFSSLGSNVL